MKQINALSGHVTDNVYASLLYSTYNLQISKA